MKKVVSIVLTLFTLFSMAACSQNSGASSSLASGSGQASTATSSATSGQKTKITLLRPGDESKVHAAIDSTVAKFMKENPDIEVSIQYASWGSWISIYPTAFQAGTQPDVIFWWDMALHDQYAAGKLVPVEDYIDPSILEEIPKPVLDKCRVNGKLYHVPTDIYGMVLYYRKDIFKAAGLDPESPPTTWDELYQDAKAITEKTKAAGIGLPGKAGLQTCHEMIAQFIAQATGKPLLDENNQATFNNEKGLQALEFVHSLLPYCSPSIASYARGDARSALIEGSIGMELGDSTWAVPAFQAKFGEDLDKSVLGVADTPVGPAGKYNWAGFDGWAITNKDKAVACGKLISFLCSPEATYQHHAKFGGMPYTKYESEQKEFKYDFWKVFKSAVSDYNLIQRIGTYSSAPSAYYTDLEPIWQDLLSDSISPKEALDQSVAVIKNINAQHGIGQ